MATLEQISQRKRMISRHNRALSQSRNPDKAGKELAVKRIVKAGVVTRKKKETYGEEPIKQQKTKKTRRKGKKTSI